MGQPNWSKIPFDKMPEWKREEILGNHKKEIKNLEVLVKKEEPQVKKDPHACEACGKVCASKAGLMAHMRVHK